MSSITLRVALALLPSVLLLGGATAHDSPEASAHGPIAPAPLQAHGPDPGTRYLPLQEGMRMTYMTADGEHFTLTFGPEADVLWFDDTIKRVVLVTDTRCDCQVLFQNVNGQIRAIGSIGQGTLDRWGEYYIIWPNEAASPTETVTTPAGRFEDAVRVTTAGGTAWFAPGVGMVQSDSFVLTAIATTKEEITHVSKDGS